MQQLFSADAHFDREGELFPSRGNKCRMRIKRALIAIVFLAVLSASYVFYSLHVQSHTPTDQFLENAAIQSKRKAAEARGKDAERNGDSFQGSSVSPQDIPSEVDLAASQSNSQGSQLLPKGFDKNKEVARRLEDEGLNDSTPAEATETDDDDDEGQGDQTVTHSDQAKDLTTQSTLVSGTVTHADVTLDPSIPQDLTTLPVPVSSADDLNTTSDPSLQEDETVKEEGDSGLPQEDTAGGDTNQDSTLSTIGTEMEDRNHDGMNPQEDWNLDELKRQIEEQQKLFEEQTKMLQQLQQLQESLQGKHAPYQEQEHIPDEQADETKQGTLDVSEVELLPLQERPEQQADDSVQAGSLPQSTHQATHRDSPLDRVESFNGEIKGHFNGIIFRREDDLGSGAFKLAANGIQSRKSPGVGPDDHVRHGLPPNPTRPVALVTPPGPDGPSGETLTDDRASQRTKTQTDPTQSSQTWQPQDKHAAVHASSSTGQGGQTNQDGTHRPDTDTHLREENHVFNEESGNVHGPISPTGRYPTESDARSIPKGNDDQRFADKGQHGNGQTPREENKDRTYSPLPGRPGPRWDSEDEREIEKVIHRQPGDSLLDDMFQQIQHDVHDARPGFEGQGQHEADWTDAHRDRAEHDAFENGDGRSRHDDNYNDYRTLDSGEYSDHRERNNDGYSDHRERNNDGYSDHRQRNNDGYSDHRERNNDEYSDHRERNNDGYSDHRERNNDDYNNHNIHQGGESEYQGYNDRKIQEGYGSETEGKYQVHSDRRPQDTQRQENHDNPHSSATQRQGNHDNPHSSATQRQGNHDNPHSSATQRQGNHDHSSATQTQENHDHSSVAKSGHVAAGGVRPSVYDLSSQPADQHRKCVSLRLSVFSRVICVPDDSSGGGQAAQRLVQRGSSEEGELREFQAALDTGAALGAVDLGAGLGVYTVAAAGKGRAVVAVEPARDTQRLLHQTLLLNSLTTHVILVTDALGEKLGAGRFTSGGSDVMGAGRVQPVQLTEVGRDAAMDLVRIIRLDDLLAVTTFSRAVLRMGVPGQEHKVFKGGRRFFAQIDVQYVLMQWTPSDGRQLQHKESAAFLRQFGLQPAHTVKGKELYTDHELQGDLGFVVWRKKGLVGV